MYDDEIKYLKGSANIEADMLSRHPVAHHLQHSSHFLDINEIKTHQKNDNLCGPKYHEIKDLITLKQMVKMNVSINLLLLDLNASSTKIPWTKLLDQVCNEYNSTPHSITKYPPAYLLFGLLPYPSPINQNNYYETVDEARELALPRTIDYHIKNKIRYDAR
ncbi:transposon Ty3-G Gag-Pol polyprotein [Trichonephila clavipes]|nr:transposon Ty3-G Gag-Pol polyprotein [Trichonephila clavipes]